MSEPANNNSPRRHRDTEGAPTGEARASNVRWVSVDRPIADVLPISSVSPCLRVKLFPPFACSLFRAFAFSSVFITLSCPRVAAQVGLQVEAGLDGVARGGRWCPVRVTASNN